MKKLISMADIEQLIAQGKKVCSITSNTIITPAAKDFAEENEICFTKEQPEKKLETKELGLLIEKLFSNQELLQKLILSLETKPYSYEKDETGYTLIHGESIQYQNNEQNVQQSVPIVFEQAKGIEIEFVKLSKGQIRKIGSTGEIHFMMKGRTRTTTKEKQFENKQGDICYCPAQCAYQVNILEDSEILVVKIS